MSFEKYKEKTNEERLEQFMSTLSLTNRTPEYYVNWEKVSDNTKKYELELHTMNYLLGKSDIEEKARELFISNPSLLKTIPVLIASRDKTLDVLVVKDKELDYTRLDFNNPDIDKIDDYMEFIERSGLLGFMRDKITNNLVDYVYGVEAGLDSNARKNRSGSTMEGLVNHYVKLITDNNQQYLTMEQATPKAIKSEWGINVPVDKSSRRYDEAIYDSYNDHLFLIETNYYGGGGSKLKSVAGEFSELKVLLESNPKITFIWVSDGQGWHTAKIPMAEAFDKIDYIFNLDMLKKGYLGSLVTNIDEYYSQWIGYVAEDDDYVYEMDK